MKKLLLWDTRLYIGETSMEVSNIDRVYCQYLTVDSPFLRDTHKCQLCFLLGKCLCMKWNCGIRELFCFLMVYWISSFIIGESSSICWYILTRLSLWYFGLVKACKPVVDSCPAYFSNLLIFYPLGHSLKALCLFLQASICQPSTRSLLLTWPLRLAPFLDDPLGSSTALSCQH